MADDKQLPFENMAGAAGGGTTTSRARGKRATRRPNGKEQSLTASTSSRRPSRRFGQAAARRRPLRRRRPPSPAHLASLSQGAGRLRYAREEEQGEAFDPVVSAPYRWRDWADVADKTRRKTGDELIEFVNDDLIPYLSRLSGPSDRDIRTIVGNIFRGTDNRVRSGYILREVVDKLSSVNFNASDDVHTVSVFYETMLKEMRDASGASGEFYTPARLCDSSSTAWHPSWVRRCWILRVELRLPGGDVRAAAE